MLEIKKIREEWAQVIQGALNNTGPETRTVLDLVQKVKELPDGAQPNLGRILPSPGWVTVGPLQWPGDPESHGSGLLVYQSWQHTLVAWVTTPRDVFNILRALRKIRAKCQIITRRIERESKWAAKRWERKYSRWTKKIEAAAAELVISSQGGD